MGATRARRRRRALSALGALVLLAGAAVALIVTGVIGGSSARHHRSGLALAATHTTIATPTTTASTASTSSQSSSTAANTTASTTKSTNTTTATTTTTAVNPAAAQQAVVAVLDRYATAYSDHDIAALSALFSPTITRRGLAAGGCTVSSGRAAVLADYRAQFSKGPGTYTLVGLSSTEVHISGVTATVNASYSISGGASGSVAFTLTDTLTGWQITRVYATCS